MGRVTALDGLRVIEHISRIRLASEAEQVDQFCTDGSDDREQQEDARRVDEESGLF
jgi:hypothetical protein